MGYRALASNRFIDINERKHNRRNAREEIWASFALASTTPFGCVGVWRADKSLTSIYCHFSRSKMK